MSGRIKIEDGVEWLADSWQAEEVHRFKGTTYYGEPSRAHVPAGQRNSRSNAKYELTDGVLIGLTYRKAHFTTDGEFTNSFYNETVVLHMTREEALHLAKSLMNDSLR